MGHHLLLILAVTVLLFGWDAAAQTSNSSCPVKFTRGNIKTYQYCNKLHALGATLSYIYHAENGSLDIAFKAAPAASMGWVGWGINPKGKQMIGTQALIAFRLSNGSTVVDTYNVVSKTLALNPSKISITVRSKSAVYESSSGKITIFATLVLGSNKTSVNQVWQVGSSVTNLSPGIHKTTGANLKSLGVLNLPSGATSAPPAGYSSHQTLKNIHGMINVVSWGIMIPIGVMIARHAITFQVAYHTWFYIHAICQSFGYIIGVSGWAIGLKLGSYSKGVVRTSHGIIGIVIFCLATLQVFAQLLQPKKDHKFRLYWNIYHHIVGYSVLILSAINVLKGFNILNPEKKWKNAFFVVGFSLGATAISLEVVKWIIFFRHKARNSSKPLSESNENGQLNGDSS
ncbi:hypothetical protein SUGI_1143500 [Cryptomeria japonica]|uniref:cytochrome b561 and DOMON domain-containing protein At4g12980 n=1 Tax=Cryptomeria japonica TaxID=3369 RepID=UPI002414C46E|nr:cytochrome b561 and DOMON domain-containing protein At4g12980 [Cryptomeria japonica]GLJ53603.1 hypothetical protein SUGI_1143500 [Cryptomeria japonica]